uniref:Uncharacterized protein n=1 Tax=Globodera pallida TaxID=36090 RepID=A0A183BVP2_GLOPA
MAHQKRFIDMVETSVSSQWIRVGDGQKDRPALSKHSETFLEKLSSGSKEHRIKSFYVNVNCPFFHNASTPFPSRHCSWSMLNTALLTWSIFSTLHWLCLLGGKLRSSVIVHRRLTIFAKTKNGCSQNERDEAENDADEASWRP